MGKEAKFIVRLLVGERKQLNDLVAHGRVAKNTRQRAMILLRVDQGEAGPGWHDERVVELLGVGLSTVHRTREQFVEEGLAATLRRKPSPNRQYRKLDGAGEAQLIALACSPPPEGRVAWTMQLLADKLVELQVVESIGEEAVRTTLKKTLCSPGGRSSGCCPPSKTPTSFVRWRTCWKSTTGHTTRPGRSSASTSKASS